jgi:lipoprotein-anchoring transpeptidase ErfK/SrfK
MVIARRAGRCALILAVLALAGCLAMMRGNPAAAETPQQVFFDTTGQVLGEPFLDAWTERGGLTVIGEPVSQPVQQGDRWVQWFKYERLEIERPTLDGATAGDVVFAPLGRQLQQQLAYLRWHPAFQPVDAAGWTDVRFFPETGHTIAHAFKGTWESNDTGARLGMPISQEFNIDGTVYQYFENGALSWHPDFGVNAVPLGMMDAALHGQLRLSGERPEGVPSFDGRPIRGAPGNGERWIDVNLSSYVLTAYEGTTPVMSTYVVDGAAGTPTARGTFYVYSKLTAQTMRGSNLDGSEYVTEDVPWVMYFYADFALHGAYWRSSFGYSGSHGCVNMPVGDAAWLFNWADYGTRVEVHD